MFNKIFSSQKKNLQLPFSFFVLVSVKQALELPRATSHLCLSAAFTAFMQKCCSPGMINSILVLSAEWTMMINTGGYSHELQQFGENPSLSHSIRCFRHTEDKKSRFRMQALPLPKGLPGDPSKPHAHIYSRWLGGRSGGGKRKRKQH